MPLPGILFNALKGIMSRSLSLHAAMLIIATGTGQLIMVGTLAALGRTIGVERLGAVTIALALATFGVGLIDFGSNPYLLRELAAGRIASTDFGRRNAARLLLGTLVAVASTAGLIFIWSDLGALWGIGPLFISILTGQTLQIAVRARESNTMLAILTIVDRAVLAVVFFGLLIFAKEIPPETSFYLAYTCGSATGAAMALLAVPREYRPNFSRLRWRDMWAGSKYYGLGGLLVTVQTLDTVIASLVGGPLVVGIYGAVNRWVAPIGLTAGAISTLITPIAASVKTASELWARIKGVVWLGGAPIVIAGVMSVNATPLVTFVLGDAFTASANVLSVLCIGAVLSGVSQPMLAIAQARGHDRLVAGLLGASASIRLGVLAPLVMYMGPLGIALSFVAAQFILVVGLLLTIGRSRRLRMRAGSPMRL